jgi:hypothetical protein
LGGFVIHGGDRADSGSYIRSPADITGGLDSPTVLAVLRLTFHARRWYAHPPAPPKSACAVHAAIRQLADDEVATVVAAHLVTGT